MIVAKSKCRPMERGKALSMSVRPAFTNEQLDRLTEAFQAICRQLEVDPKGHDALKIASRLLDECDGSESQEEIVERFAA